MNQLVTIRRAAAATIVVPAVLLAAACSSSAPTMTAPSAGPSQTSSTPAEAPTSTAPAPASTSAPTSSSAAPLANGNVDKAEFIDSLKSAAASMTSAHVSMSTSGAGQSLKMEGDTKLDPSNPAMQVKMAMLGMNLEMKVVDKKVYLKGLPNQAAGKWAVFDESSEIGKQMSAAAAQADPRRTFEQFDKALIKVNKLGTEKIDGEQMDKYALTLDTKKVMGSVPAAGGASLPKTLDYTAWVDAKNHLRRVDTSVAGVKATTNISKYGEPVDITAPPAKDVVKGTGL